MHKGVTGFFVGSVISATIALLYAPRSGEETRREIKDGVLAAKQRAQLTIEDAKMRAIDTASEVQSKTQVILERINQETQQKTGRLKEIGATMVDEQKASLARGVEEAQEVLNS